MPRIYALAKDLQLESSELLEIVTRAGIQGKSSPLASLEDDEVDRVKDFMKSKAKPGGVSAPAPTSRPSAPSRPPALSRPSAAARPPASAASPRRVEAPIRQNPSREDRGIRNLSSRTGGVRKASPSAEPKFVQEAPVMKAPVNPAPADEAASVALSFDQQLDRAIAAAKVFAKDAPPAPSRASGAAKPPASRPNEARPVENRASDMPPSNRAGDAVSRSGGAGRPGGAPSGPLGEASRTAKPSGMGGAAPPARPVPGGEPIRPAGGPSTSTGSEARSGAPPVEPSEGAAPRGDAPASRGGSPLRSMTDSRRTDGPRQPPGSLARRDDRFAKRDTGAIRRLTPGPVRRKDEPGSEGQAPPENVPPAGETRRPEGRPMPGDGARGQDKNRAPVRLRPLVSLAAMPEAKAPLKPKEGEKAQKPTIRLTAEEMLRRQKNQDAPLQGVMNAKANKGPGGVATPGGVDERGRRGVKTAREEELEKEEQARKARMERNRRGRGGRRRDDDGDYRIRRGTRTRGSSTKDTSAPRKQAAALEMPATVRSFSEAAGVPAGQILKWMLVNQQRMLNINATLTDEDVDTLVMEFGVELDLKRPESIEDEVTALVDAEDDSSDLELRPPVVTFLGHVDHGKTSLLDRIIGINVVDREAGGITQHIRAYQIEHNDQKIAFVDTPGHEAFTEMRARGANVTDIAVLVIAADDGIMPQTEEAINHIRAAGVPIVVALNKWDLPGTNEQKLFEQLAAQNLIPSQWGGDVEVVKTSALKGTGIDELLDTILTISELNEYKANPHRDAVASVLEAEQEPGRGVIAKVMVKNGTLRVGDVFVCGETYGRVRAMYNPLHRGERMKEAGPSTPVNITGLEAAPMAGDQLVVLHDIGRASELALQRFEANRSGELSQIQPRVTLEEFQRRLETGSLADKQADLVHLNLIVRADTRGSIEAIKKELSKIDHPEILIRILQAGVGGVTTADVSLAEASDAIVLAFGVTAEEEARSLADSRGIEIRRYEIIYRIIDDIRQTLEGRLKPERREADLGMAVVQRVFTISRVGAIAGCRVVRGTIERHCRIRVVRDQRIVGDYALDTLRREKDDVAEVRQGMECGIKLVNFNDIKESDILQAYKVEEIARTL